MLCPVADAISASVAPLIAARVTKVPRRSLKVTPATPALLHVLRHDDEKPCDVHGFPSELRSIIGERRCVALSISLSGADHRNLDAHPGLALRIAAYSFLKWSSTSGHGCYSLFSEMFLKKKARQPNAATGLGTWTLGDLVRVRLLLPSKR